MVVSDWVRLAHGYHSDPSLLGSKNHSVTGLSFARHNGATTLSPPGRADLNEKKSVAIQAAEYGILRLCCSYDITHSIIFIVNGIVASICTGHVLISARYDHLYQLV